MTELIPPRPTDGSVPTGSSFMSGIKALTWDQFEQRVYQEIARGNVPDFVRPENFREVTVSATIGGRTVEARVRVAPDYLAIGSNTDFIRVPISPLMAQRLATRYGLALPTDRLVDVIDEAAKKAGGYLTFVGAPEIASRVVDPDSGQKVSARWNYKVYGRYEARWMESPIFAQQQSQMTDSQSGVSAPIRSGHKKDVIYHQDLPNHPNDPRVAIYHRGIQPSSTIHHDLYMDYSHGIRFISPDIQVTTIETNGSRVTRPMTLSSILQDKTLYQLFSASQMNIDQMYRRDPNAAPQKAVAR
ncbi:MAG: hypothetical protein U0R44_01075 [Candidatus Micrarchaeia archaeon]